MVAFETARGQHQHYNNTECKDKDHDSFHFFFFLLIDDSKVGGFGRVHLAE